MKINLTQRKKGFAILAAVLVLTLAVPRPAQAIFGFGDVVFDPTSYATLGHIWSQDITNYAKFVQTVTQLEKIYGQGLEMYQLGQAAAQFIDGPKKAELQSIAQMAVQDFTEDQQGENALWSSTLNGNPKQAPSAWKMATVALNQGINLAQETPGHSAALARLATLEAMDGTSTGCLQTLAQYHSNTIANTIGPILKLAIARADGTAKTNSEVEQLNLLNAHQGQANNEMMAQGQINSCLAQQMMLANKIQRDNQAEAFNTFAQMQSNVAGNPMRLAIMSSSLNADIQ